ncbi:uncharacterized protein SPSK_05502 [Sporothrix schenckii 1099-18]|uniref:Uncharacterized protein n=1 Tax=Sporothrix schenckii 1099-18 TaxID=1397361 RepID=A0A0F2LUH1_SPOSC|nr:uncharacterized protein SPSK_05502 [Sporothrix schenckii 1099-18]KJR80479.1 hypothetical protein SPSK_05502 [Sporothrix schenckii 1099-18]
MIVLAMMAAMWQALRLLSPDLRVVMDPLSVILMAYAFLPPWSCVVVPALVYIPVNFWLRVFLSRRHILIGLACCALCLEYRVLTGMSPPLLGGLETFVRDAFLDPFDTLVAPFVESIDDGLVAIEFYEHLEEDMEAIADFLAYLLHSCIGPDNWFLALFRFIGHFFAFVARCDDMASHLAEMVVDGGCKLTSSYAFWLVAGPRKKKEAILAVQRRANESLIDLIEQQQQVMVSTDFRVNALSDRVATVLNTIWFNVFRPGARQFLRYAEFD